MCPSASVGVEQEAVDARRWRERDEGSVVRRAILVAELEADRQRGDGQALKRRERNCRKLQLRLQLQAVGDEDQ